ncbi:MAG TPA: hypothetical protein VM779_12375 [Thermoanaerobaculia bacterium]|nr:hypothetical protein [Thermoanaerobaculia bacterium]
MTPNKLSFPLAAILLAGSALVGAPRAEATVSLAATFDEKVENAQAIVLGRVVRSESRFDDEQRFILTYTTFEVEKSIKGGTPPQVTVVTPGGRVGEIQQTTIGVPHLAPGEENVLFLKDTRHGPTVLYFDQGAYEVVSQRGERIVRPVVTGAVHIDEQRGVAVAPEPARTLREFEGAVQASERRTRFNRMEMLREEQRRAKEAASIWPVLADYKWLFLAAALGLALATVLFLRRG